MTRAVDPPCSSECAAHRQAGSAIGRTIYFALVKHANEGTAAEETSKMPLLVAEDGDVNTDVPRCLVL